MTDVRILAVEDLRLVAKDLQSRLKRLGYDVRLASNGPEAIQRAGELRPDVVLMDIILEGEMDGTEAARQIRQQYGIPVIYLTAHADEETVHRAGLTDPAGYVLKPFDDRELDQTIRKALGQVDQ